MAEAFRLAVEAGRKAYLAGPGRVIEHGAVAHHHWPVSVRRPNHDDQ